MSEVSGSDVQLSGHLIMETTIALFNKGLRVEEGQNDLTVDFARVDMVDSSAISLMLAWLRWAQRKNVKLSFLNVPDNLRSLANLYGVEESLSLIVDAK